MEGLTDKMYQERLEEQNIYNLEVRGDIIGTCNYIKGENKILERGTMAQ